MTVSQVNPLHGDVLARECDLYSLFLTSKYTCSHSGIVITKASPGSIIYINYRHRYTCQSPSNMLDPELAVSEIICYGIVYTTKMGSTILRCTTHFSMVGHLFQKDVSKCTVLASCVYVLHT